MGFIKTILIWIIIIAILWAGIGIYIGYFTEPMADIPRFQIVLNAPVHLWHIFKSWVMSI